MKVLVYYVNEKNELQKFFAANAHLVAASKNDETKYIVEDSEL